MTIGSFAKTFADIDLDDGNQDSVPVDYDNEKVEEVNNLVRLLMHWNNLLRINTTSLIRSDVHGSGRI
ncbi:hypothetical protein Goshw_018612 [Gossypium schwendimanii]|uniref:Uncharacterized protein n=1 Tax=Gossypium schwendimanii TaxID=34291 RepID=A0A7J9MD48_GOSSC|nr:hypothetical protein [Gossypium schwendimanii]